MSRLVLNSDGSRGLINVHLLRVQTRALLKDRVSSNPARRRGTEVDSKTHVSQRREAKVYPSSLWPCVTFGRAAISMQRCEEEF